MPDFHDVESVWQTLETSSSGVTTKLDVAPIGVELVAGAALAGIDSDGNRHLLFPLLEGEAFPSDSDRANVRMIRLKIDDMQYASVVCVRRELDEIFAQFTRELLGPLAESTSPAREARQALELWRRLFSSVRPELLSVHSQVGLFGELLTLQSILDTHGTAGLEVWTGPDGSQHDFRSLGSACEVKSTLSREGRRIPISSLDQLEPPQDTDLYLMHYRLELHPGGRTLPGLIAQVQTHVNETELQNKLRKVGYREVDRDQYPERYVVAEVRTYLVDADFPRIVPSSFVKGALPAGVESLEYVIQLTGAPPYPLDAHDSAAVLKRLARV